MGLPFFDRQRAEGVVGILAVRLQKSIIILWLFAFAAFLVNVTIQANQGGAFDPSPLIGLTLQGLVLLIGWKGAVQRRTGFLLAYFIITLVSVILNAAVLSLVVFAASFLVSAEVSCAEDVNCSHHEYAQHIFPHLPAMIGLGLFGLIVFGFIPYLVTVYSCVASWHTRKEVLKARRVVRRVSSMEEGQVEQVQAAAVETPQTLKTVSQQMPIVQQMPVQQMPIQYIPLQSMQQQQPQQPMQYPVTYAQAAMPYYVYPTAPGVQMVPEDQQH
jgi:hypothetical protein